MGSGSWGLISLWRHATDVTITIKYKCYTQKSKEDFYDVSDQSLSFKIERDYNSSFLNFQID